MKFPRPIDNRINVLPKSARHIEYPAPKANVRFVPGCGESRCSRATKSADRVEHRRGSYFDIVEQPRLTGAVP